VKKTIHVSQIPLACSLFSIIAVSLNGSVFLNNIHQTNILFKVTPLMVESPINESPGHSTRAKSILTACTVGLISDDTELISQVGTLQNSNFCSHSALTLLIVSNFPHTLKAVIAVSVVFILNQGMNVKLDVNTTLLVKHHVHSTI
jgi:hypothetical protein